MAKKTRKVSFYRLGLIQQIPVDRNTIREHHLQNNEIEEKFNRIYEERASALNGGGRALSVSTNASDYVVEIMDYANHLAFVKIGQQNPSNTVALRDMTTLETEDVPMRASQSLELYTFCLIDFETGIVSYIGINGAPKISAIRNLFNESLYEENIYASLAAIMTNDILQTLVSKRVISKVSLTVAVPEDHILRDIGVGENTFDSLQHVKTSTATYNVVANKNKNIFRNSTTLGELIASVREKFGDNLKKMSANAKDYNEQSQTYDLLHYNFTKTVTLSNEDTIFPTLEEYRDALESTYNRYKAELVEYSRI